MGKSFVPSAHEDSHQYCGAEVTGSKHVIPVASCKRFEYFGRFIGKCPLYHPMCILYFKSMIAL